MNQHGSTQAYEQLEPEQILDSVENQGFICDGRLLALNSYENRVYRVGLEDGSSIIAKFYRPNRWSNEQIEEEHAFARELYQSEVPVVAPLEDTAGQTLFVHGSYRFALFPNAGGRAPQLDNLDHLEQLGRFIGRIHAIGASKPFAHRPSLNPETFGKESYQYLLQHDFIPKDLIPAYESLTLDLMTRVQWCYQRCDKVNLVRVHGDCHSGNILWTEQGPHIVDLDDARNAPAAQDIWMFLFGDRADQTASLHAVLEGYTQFYEFDARQLHLFEALRTLRMMYYYAWLAKRWEDPAFPRAFPWFNTQRCWEEHILALREQAAAMEEEPLHWPQ